MTGVIRALVGFSVLTSLGACTPEPAEDPSGAARGKALYQARCAACHGATGQGDGPAAQNQDPAPPDLTGLAARNGGVFDRDYVMSVIYAAPSTGQGGLMPAFGHGDLGDLVIVEEDGVGTPVFTDLLALARYLETVQD